MRCVSMQRSASPSTAQLQGRIETRWILPAASYERVRKRIRTYFKTIKYSDRPWVKSILFNNDSHDVPPEISIKLRRYFKQPTTAAFRPAQGKWFLDTDVTDTGLFHQKDKSRTEMDFAATVMHYRRKDALCAVSGDVHLCPLNTPLRPYIAIEFHREHFADKEGSCRVTLDRDIRFWHQLPEGTWIPLGKEYGIRLEIKCLPAVLAAPRWSILRSALIHERALPIVGKRYAALNRLSSWQRTLVPLPVDEAPGVKYGISFEVPATAGSTLSAELYQRFSHTRRFAIKADRPWVAEGGLIRIYFQDYFRLNLYGDTFRWIWTAPPRPRASTTLIRRRRQEQSEHRLITPAQIEELFSTHLFHGALLQGRRQFWVEDKDKRIYQISVFRSSNFSTHRWLTQLNLQYIGRSVPADPRHPEKKIERQLRTLAQLLEPRRRGLVPARRSLFAFAAMHGTNTLNPIAQILSLFDTRTRAAR